MNDSLKVIVRNLPPDMREEDFVKEFFTANSIVDITEDVLWYFFVKGRQKTVAMSSSTSTERRSQEETMRLGYSFIYFENKMSLDNFFTKNHRRPLQDKNGNVYVCVIEYSPVQKMPSCKFVYRHQSDPSKTLSREILTEHLLEDDTDFLEFRDKTLLKESTGRTAQGEKETKEKVIQWLESKLKQENEATDLVRDLAQLWKAESAKESKNASKAPKKAADEKRNKSDKISKRSKKKKQSKAPKTERMRKSEKPSFDDKGTRKGGPAIMT